LFINTIINKIIHGSWLIVASLILVTPIHSQELNRQQLDSLYTKFLQIRAPELLSQSSQLIPLTPEDRKCGFGVVNEAKSNFNNFSLKQQNILKPFLQRPQLPNNIVSPNQHFRIHYTTTGADAIGYDINLLAQAVDSAYSFEINYLGYPPPPPDGSEGGDEKYDIYVINLGNLYGQTTSETNIGTSSWISYIEMDNDFPWYSNATPPKQPIDAARVTVAHEFHHAIQFGNYAPTDGSSYRASDTYFYELTSTSMEEFVYNTINDYYTYMSSYFNSTYKTFPNHIGYDMAIWNIFLVKNYGFEVIKSQWEAMPTQRALYAINSSLYPIGTSFQKEYNKFGIWTYFTSYRAVPGLYFDEAMHYPLVTPLVTISYPQFNYAQVDAYATSNNFIRFSNITNGDTLISITTNGDINSALNQPTNTFNFIYTLFSDTISGSRKLADKYSADFSLSGSGYWSLSEILNDVVVLADSIEKQIPNDLSYAYPNPFNYKSNFLSAPLVFFPFESRLGETVDFGIYSVGMKLIYGSVLQIQNLPGDQKGVSWNGLDQNKNKLASGVYIYVIKRGDDILKGKIVIFNE